MSTDIGKIKILISKIQDRKLLHQLSTYCRGRADIIWARERVKERAAHIAQIKALAAGAKVMVKQNYNHFRVGQVATIVSHKPRSPQTLVEFVEDGKRWYVPSEWLQSVFTAEDQQRETKSSQMVQKLNTFLTTVRFDVGKKETK